MLETFSQTVDYVQAPGTVAGGLVGVVVIVIVLFGRRIRRINVDLTFGAES